MSRPIRATMENLKKYGNQRGVVMYSPKTGERYSATPGDYFMTSPNHVFKGERGANLYLGVHKNYIDPIMEVAKKKKKSGTWSRKKTTNKRRI
jgi:hypothetical protein